MLGSGLLTHGGVTKHPKVRQECDFLPFTHTLVNVPLLLQVATSQKGESGSKQRRGWGEALFQAGPRAPSQLDQRAPGAGRSSKTELHLLPLPWVPVSPGNLRGSVGSGGAGLQWLLSSYAPNLPLF